MKVLLSAYACRPGAGSEPGVGFETLLAVAQVHDVWVLTRTKNIPLLNAYLERHPLVNRVTPVGIDLSNRSMRWKKRLGSAGLHWYYDRWQVIAAARALELDKNVRFDLVHHVTFSADWARAGTACINLPFVWGPIGGEVLPPWRLLSTLGARGILEESLRAFVRWAMRKRRSHKYAWEHARAVLVQNQEMVNRANNPQKTTLLPHGTAIRTELGRVAERRTKEILVVGRLVPWKGGTLAVRAMKYLVDPHAVLSFLGSGPDTSRLKHLSDRLGVRDRIRFEGVIPRDAVLDRVAAAGVLLHPAVHDESPIAVGEALSLGTPVVCLDRGGPPELLRSWPKSPGVAVAIENPEGTARLLARAIDQFLTDPPPIALKSFRPATSYAGSILSVYDDVGRGSPPRESSGDGVLA